MLIETREGPGSGRLAIVLLHGFMGFAEDLAPFAKSLGVRARFVFPDGPVDLAPRGLRGRAWWPIDVDSRRDSPEPRDLSGVHPQGLDDAREHLTGLIDRLDAERPLDDLVIGGFSQGAMLACDWVLRSTRRVDGLAMFSGARIAADEWAPRYAARRGLRAFLSHGRSDAELSFSAAESFQADLAGAGWAVTWLPFDGGHQIPVTAWRAFKRWLTP